MNLSNDIELDPSIVHFEYGMMCLYRLQQHDKARMQFELAIAIDPMYCEALLELALLLASHYGCMEDARGYMARVLAINPRLHIARTKMQEWGFADMSIWLCISNRPFINASLSIRVCFHKITR